MKVIISGGGTGGHIFPAIAIGRALQKHLPGIQILFVGAKGKMEMQKVPQAGFQIHGLWISGFKRSLSATNLLFPVKVLWSMFQAFHILRRFRPDVAVGVGGYASGPLLRMASWMGIPTMIQEQNSYPGVTNRALARMAVRIFTAYPGMESVFPAEKTELTGNPVRKEVVDIKDKKEEALKYFGLTAGRPVILVIGGSQGARSLNEAMESNLGRFEDNDRQWIWQTGTSFYEKAKALSDATRSGNVAVRDFITRMDLAYAAADLIVSRAGAISITELCNVGKPIVLVPYPFAAADHQTRNAEVLENAGAAIMIKDSQIKRTLFDTLNRLIEDAGLREHLSDNLRKWAIPDADDRIAEYIINWIVPKKPSGNES